MATAVGAGLTLFLGSTAFALWRASHCVLWNRLIVLGITLAVLAWSRPSSAQHVLGLAGLSLSAIVAIEQVTVRRRLQRG